MRALLFAVMLPLAAAATSGDEAHHGRAGDSGSSQKKDGAGKDVQGDAANFDKYMSNYAGDYEKYMHGSGQAPQGSAGNYRKYMSQYAADYQQYMPQHDLGASQAGPGNSQYVSQYADKYQKYMKLSQGDRKVSGDHGPVTLMAEAQHPVPKTADAKEGKDSKARDAALGGNSESRGQGRQDSHGSASTYQKYMSQYASDHKAYMPKDAGGYHKYMSQYSGDYQKYMSQYSGKASDTNSGGNQELSGGQSTKFKAQEGVKPMLLLAEAVVHSDAKDSKTEAEKQRHRDQLTMGSQQQPTERETEKSMEQVERNAEHERLAKELSSDRAELEAEMKRERAEREAEKEHLRQELMQEEKLHAQQAKTLDTISGGNQEHPGGVSSNFEAQEGVKPMFLIAEAVVHSDAKDSKTEAEKQRHGDQLTMGSQQQPTERETEKSTEQVERDAEHEQLAKELSSERAELEAEMKRERAERDAEKEHLRQELMQEEKQHAQQQKKQGPDTSVLMDRARPSVLKEASPSHPIVAVATLAGLGAVALLTTGFRSLNLGAGSSHTEYVQPPPAEV